MVRPVNYRVNLVMYMQLSVMRWTITENLIILLNRKCISAL